MSTFSFVPRIDDVPEYTEAVVRQMGEAFDRTLVRVSLTEALLNAVIYGALGVDPGPEERDPSIFRRQLEAAERAVPPNARVLVEVKSLPESDDLEVSIIDPGPGFDWGRVLEEQDAPSDGTDFSRKTRGRGIGLMLKGAASMRWNDAGNHLRLRFKPVKPTSR